MGAHVLSDDANGDAFELRVRGHCAAASSSASTRRRHAAPSSSASSCSTQHRRSKSASERSANFTKPDASCTGKRSVLSQVRSDSQRVTETTLVENAVGTSLHQHCGANDYRATSSHRASLENDIKQLQTSLQREKSVRDMLEKAIGRTSSALSPGHKNFATQTPKIRHQEIKGPAEGGKFQTRKLVEEIELLEEEVANREQHVLSLYRAIFDQSLNGTTLEQSSGITHPSYKRTRTKKHPSVISCAFCSSRKFPLRHFQVKTSIVDYSKKNTLHDAESIVTANGNANAREQSEVIKAKQEAPVATKHFFFYTMRDHLYQYPNKLSEELVKCMVAVFSFMCKETLTKQDKEYLPCSPGSTMNTVLPHRVTKDDKWSSRSTVEITWISTDKKNLSSASYVISSYRSFVEQLQKVDVDMLESNAKLAFWINVYNSLVMHAYLTYGIARSSLKRISLFHKAAYNIGGHVISANFIEHDILCCRTLRTGRWFDAMISTAMRKRSGEDKLSSRISFVPFPVTCFALCTGAYSDPKLNVYTARNAIGELEEAKKEFLQANVFVKETSKVFLPKLLDRYAKEASFTSDDLLAWVSENVDMKLSNAIKKCTESHPRRKASQVIEWVPYDPRFRYIFAKDLIDKAR